MSATANPYLLGADALVASRPSDVIVHSIDLEDLDDVFENICADLDAMAQARKLPTVQLRSSVAPVPAPTLALRSEIPMVSDEAWTTFVQAMKVQEPSAVSASNEIGMFAMKPRRLADLGVIKNVKPFTRRPERMLWVGDWVSPYSQREFLRNHKQQYQIFADSMRRFCDGIRDESIPFPPSGIPDELSLSGVLAILHRCGPSGLLSWTGASGRFPATVTLVNRTNGIF